MRKFIRSEAPDFLIKNWEKWGKNYKNNREKKSAFVFQWPSIYGQKINSLLSPNLSKLTDGHCSYCDSFPIKSKEVSIDHFKPKSIPEYFELVCHWENLYFCCHNCQQYKGEKYDQHLLRPDDENYSYETYFIYSYSSHEISPHPALSNEMKIKAETTIKIFGLNDIGHIKARCQSYERYEDNIKLGKNIDIDDYAYRFIFMDL